MTTNILTITASILVIALAIFAFLKFAQYRRKILLKKYTPPPAKKQEPKKGYVTRLPSREERALTQKEDKIVGIAEPVGFWTRLILSEKMDFILATLRFESGQTKEGYWQQYIKAQQGSSKHKRGNWGGR